MNNTYTIKPLEWASVGDEQFPKFVARNPFAEFTVERGLPGKWVWFFRFRRNDVQNEGSCDSEEEGKAVCEKEWLRRLRKVLQPVA